MSFSDISGTDDSGWTSYLDAVKKIPLQANLRVHTCFRLTVSPDWRIVGRENPDLHLLLVCGGHGEYTVRGRRIELRRGVLVFVGSGVFHSSSADPDDLPQIIPIRFGLYGNRNPQKMIPHFLPVAFQVQNADMTRYEPLFNRIADCVMRQNPFEKDLPSSLLHQVLVELIRERESSFQDIRITRIRQRIEMNPQERVSLESIAEDERICPRHLRRLFAEETGMSPAEYRIRARVTKARQLLRESNLSVKEIAAELGYTDGFTFSRQFKQVSGLSPTTYRQQSIALF